MSPPKIVIDAEFADLIPPLHEDEKRELEASLVENGGPRDPLVAWDSGDFPPVLLDGHNRYEICTRLGLPFSITKIALPGRDEARRWIERNQLGRRNLSREQYSLIIGRLYNRSKLRQGGQGNNPKPKGLTRDRMASEYGVDDSTIDRMGRYQKAAEKLGIESAIAAGKIKASKARVMAAAKMVPESPTREQVDAALLAAKVTPFPRERLDLSSPREQSGWLLPAEPNDCLKAIKFYAMQIAHQYPEHIPALNNMLIGIVQENRCRVPMSERKS